jgi:two-component system response regulator NreC
VDTTENEVISKAKGRSAPVRASAPGLERRVLRVWVVDDNAALREPFAQLLTQQPSIRCKRQFPSAQAVLAALAEERPPDMILLGIYLGGQRGLPAIKPIKKLAPSVKVLMLTMFSNSYDEAEALRAGASGFVLMSYELEEIVKLIHEAHRNPGAPGLFPNMAVQRETEPELGAEGGGARRSGRRLGLAGALRRLWRAPRRETAG